MLTSKIGTIAVLLLSLTAYSASAQWLNYPTPGIPRTKDGKPNLGAPAPRTPDRKPDLSGLWILSGLGTATSITDTEMLPAARALFDKRLATYANDDPTTACLPEGPRAGVAGLDPFRIVQSRHITFVLHEANPFRQIFTDGRPLPNDMNPTWMGYSIGRWEGDTFVVTTAGFNDKTWLDFLGRPHSEMLRVTERYRRTDFGHMLVEMTYDDPPTYVKPFTVKLNATFVADDDLLENICLENEKDRAKLVGTPADEKRNEKKVPVSILTEFAGKYVVGPFGEWSVAVVDDSLTIQLPDGGGRQRLFATADNVFVFPSTGGSVTFVKDPATKTVTHLVFTIVEGDFKAERK